jgi:hypothetical protein
MSQVLRDFAQALRILREGVAPAIREMLAEGLEREEILEWFIGHFGAYTLDVKSVQFGMFLAALELASDAGLKPAVGSEPTEKPSKGLAVV